MNLTIRGTQFKILLYHHFIPVGIEKIVSRMNNEPILDVATTRGRKLEGKIALITGAHRGIGFYIAKRLIQDGAKVIITGRDETQLQKAVEVLGAANAKYLQWDISKHKECDSYFAKAWELYGTIDILVNNAGVTTDRKDRVDFENMDTTHIRYVHGINTIGTRAMCITFAKHAKSGTILNIISNTGVRAAQDAYFSSKWATYSFTKAYAEELRMNSDITLNGLCPGPIKTDMSFGPGTSIFRKEIPNRRIGLPEEIAELSFIQVLSGLRGQTGDITICDGGESLN